MEDLSPHEMNWDIRRQGRAWDGDEAHDRFSHAPEKVEMIEGQVFWTEEDRLMMLGLLLENVGLDKAVRFGDPALWRQALKALEAER